MASGDYICQKCFRSAAVLKALGKYRTSQGYAQCADCFSDLEYESAVIMEINYKREREEGVPIPEWHFKHLLKNGLLRGVNYEQYKERVAERFAATQEFMKAEIEQKKEQIKKLELETERLEAKLETS